MSVRLRMYMYMYKFISYYIICSVICREIREGTELELYLKIGVHTGHVVCGIVGTTRWTYDVFSADVIVAREVMQACTPG